MKRVSGCPSKIIFLSTLLAVTQVLVAQSPTPTPDQRGLGVKGDSSKTDSQSAQGAREAKPELVLQTGYNNLYGATRFLFSPDGRLLATTTMRSGTVKLWETATGRELRNLSGGA